MSGVDGWESRAACRGLDPDLFFPKRGQNISREAKAACAGCPVRPACLHHHLWEEFGFFGGMREDLRHKLRMAPNKRCPTCSGRVKSGGHSGVYCGDACVEAACAPMRISISS